MGELYYVTQWDSLQVYETSSIFKQSNSITHHINRLKKKKIILTEAEKVSIHEKMLSKLGTEGNFLSLTESTYKEKKKKAVVNNILHGERLNILSLRPGRRQECPFSPLMHVSTGGSRECNKMRKRKRETEEEKKQKKEGRKKTNGRSENVCLGR